MSALCHGACVRMSVEFWPPGAFFDAVYAAVVIRTFGAQNLQGCVQIWDTLFSPDHASKTRLGLQMEHQSMEKARRATGKAIDDHDRDQQLKERHQDEPDAMDLITLALCQYVSREELASLFVGNEEAEQEQLRQNAEKKVNAWRERVP